MAMVLEALASYVQNMLMEITTQEMHMLLGVSDEIEKMSDKLGDLKNILADADKRNITDTTVQAWVKELKGAMYDATNIIDLCQLKAMEDGPRRDLGCFNPLLFCLRNPLHAHDIGSQIKNLNQRLDSIRRRSKNFNFINLSSYDHHSTLLPSARLASRETSAELDESGVVGEKIEEDTRNLVGMLTKQGDINNYDENKVLVFAIVGLGGIGKTTLAKKIMNNEVIRQEFNKKVWLSVNENFSDIELLRRAVVVVEGDHQATADTKGALEQALKKALNGCKTLLVMDDVWNHHAWESVLKTPFINAVASGSRVLITTRHDMVARGVKAMFPYHHVDKLEPEDAWSLLKKQVLANGNDEPQIENLKDTGMRIIAKCDCLPLAVKVMGGLLCQKKTTRGEWENVLNDSIWSETQMTEELNHAIYLSYQDLQPSLKPCFLHYSLLPKSTIFFDNDIVGMWIAEGLVHGNSHDLEKLAGKYYDELIQRNLIEPDRGFIDQIVCSMHDVVRSFAKYVAIDETLVTQSSEIGVAGKVVPQSIIRLSLETKGSDQLEWSSLQAHTSLRTLVLVGHIKLKVGDSLVCFSSLRTLHIQDAEFDILVESLYHLKHLRYLSIECTNTSRLPESIGEMKFLQYISLLGCESLVKLPFSIGKLRQLRFLNLTSTGINNVPRGLDGLTNLRKLYGFPAHMDGDCCSLEQLGPLSNLSELGITGLENVASSSFAVKARLGEKEHLRSVSLDCTSRPLDDDGRLVKEEEGIPVENQQLIEEVFDELRPPPCLEAYGIRGYFGRRLPRWMKSTEIASFDSLRILMMENLPCFTELPDGLCQLPCLEHLRIKGAPAIKHVRQEFMQPHHHDLQSRSQTAAAFPRLCKLELGRMVQWEEWEWEEKVQAMPLLVELRLEKCKLRCVPPGLAFHTRALRELLVYNVAQLKSLGHFASVVQFHVADCPDLERISDLPKLQKLIIAFCPKLKVEGVPALESFNLQDYDMETLPRYLQHVNPRHLLLDCTLSLLKSIAAGKSSLEWGKFSHIRQVKAYADDAVNNIIPRKWYVLYTRDPYSFETNISRSAIVEARVKRMWFPYSTTCPIEDEWMVGRAHLEKRQPLCQRLRWIAYIRLHPMCLHCREAGGIAYSSDQWVEETV
ncbi:hypothetical protein ACP4OV_014612 [Aristida adscensionis]